MAEKVQIDVGELRRLYVDEGLSLRDLGWRFDLSPAAILRRLDRAGIARRRPGHPGREVRA